MSVLVCGGKLTYPIKYNTDKQGIEGVHYIENLDGYLPYNQGVERVIFLETVDNEFSEEYFREYRGDVVLYTSKVDERNHLKEELDYIESIRELDGLRLSGIQWVIMAS